MPPHRPGEPQNAAPPHAQHAQAAMLSIIDPVAYAEGQYPLPQHTPDEVCCTRYSENRA